MVEMVGFCQKMWFVMLEFARDRVLGVDTPGQQEPSCVQYPMASAPCSDEWELA
jgi:hypothetical protein